MHATSGRALHGEAGKTGKEGITMKTLKHFDWKSAAFATWVFLAIIGAIALGVWFANPLRWLEMAASLIVVAGGWCITFKLTQAIRARRKPAGKSKPVPVVSSAVAMRKVFLYFNPDTGEEVFKMEPVGGGL